MRNMIRSDFYRFTHMKSTWVLTICAAVLMLFMSFTLGFVLGDAEWLKVMMADYDEICNQLGMQNPFTLYREMYLFSAKDSLDFVTQTITRDLAVIMTIFVSLFAASVKSSGFIKNIAFAADRKTRFFSKALVMLVFSFMITGAGALASFIMSLLFFQEIGAASFGAFLLYLVLFALLDWTVGLVVMIFMDLFRKTSTGLALSILYQIMGAVMFYLTADSMLQAVFGEGFFIEFFTPLGNMSLLSYGKWDTYLASAIVVVLYFVFAALTETVFKKNKDLI